MNKRDYWLECIETSFAENGLSATVEQIANIAGDVEGAHENIGMAFYSPPPSDRYAEIEREWRGKLTELQREFDTYRSNAVTAVKQALKQHSDANISIGEYGEVSRHDGRTTRIQ